MGKVDRSEPAAARWRRSARKRASQLVRYGVRPTGAALRVFVGGCQRSGTNLLMSTLDARIETEVYHEKDPRAFDDFRLRDRETLARLSRRARAPVVVFKALCESQEIGALLDAFAPAKALWMIRDHRDVVNSLLRSWPRHAHHIHRMAADPSSAAWRGRGMSAETHRIVRRFARPDLDEANAAAVFWYLRNVLFFEQGLDRDPRVLLVRYESFVRYPEEEARRVDAFLDLDTPAEGAAAVFATSVGREAAPPLAPETEELCQGLRRRFDAVEETLRRVP